MRRAAAKNNRFVAVVCGPEQYAPIIAEMHDKGTLTDDEFTAAKRKMLGL